MKYSTSVTIACGPHAGAFNLCEVFQEMCEDIDITVFWSIFVSWVNP
jgi:hypothetical protein